AAPRPTPRTPVEFLQDRGRAVVSTVRQFWNPRLQAPASSHHVRRRSWHNSADADDDDGSDDGGFTRRRTAGRRPGDSREGFGADDGYHRPPPAHSRYPRRQRSVGSRSPSPGPSPRPSRRSTGYTT